VTLTRAAVRVSLPVVLRGHDDLVVVALFVDTLLLHALIAGLLIATFCGAHGKTVRCLGLYVRQGKQTLKVAATARGADGKLPAEYQRFKFVVAGLADVLVNRHTLYLERLSAVRQTEVGHFRARRTRVDVTNHCCSSPITP